jgi:hypothetical protein
MHQGSDEVDVPVQWREYRCEEYFRDGWSERGHFHEPSQTFVIVTADQVYEEPESDFLAIGRSGGDGIDFGYRKGIDGLWAFYPIELDFKLMAKSVAELSEAWCAGKLCV